MHNQGFVHWDIKLENVILDNDFNLKIIDFGLAENLRTKHNEKILTTGTTGYIAPEQLYNDGSYKICLQKCEIFSMGVFLFIMLRGCSPFIEPEKTDPYYQFIIQKRENYFWKTHQSWR